MSKMVSKEVVREKLPGGRMSRYICCGEKLSREKGGKRRAGEIIFHPSPALVFSLSSFVDIFFLLSS